MAHNNILPSDRTSKGFPIINRVGIRLKITLPYLFLVIVFSLGVATLASKIILETVDERFTNQLYEAGKIASEAVANEEARLLATMRLLSNMQGVAETIQQGDPENLRKLTLGTVINHQEEVVVFLNADRGLVLSLHKKAGGLIEEYEGATGGSAFADWEIVQKVSTGGADALGDKFAGEMVAGRERYFFIAGPVRGPDNHLAGIILIGKSLNSLARQIREETLSQVTIYHPGGEPLASTFPSPAALEPGLVLQILASQDENSYRLNSNRRDFDSLEMHYGEILGPWEVRGDADLGVLGVALVKNTLITASLPTRIQVTALITLTVLIVLVVGIYVATLITQPLLHLVKASQVVARGNLEVQVPVSSQDEIADLAVSFNAMIDSLQQSKNDLVDSYDKTLHGWSKALEYRDHETQGHSHRVTDLTLKLARKLGISEDELHNFRRGAVLHDIGKMGIPDAILRKEGPLSSDEWGIMRKHPQYAYDMLGDIAYLQPALEIPYCHHERWDGSGYPRGLRGKEIPLAARLFAIVDVWDALTSDRPYRRAMDTAAAMRIIQDGSGRHFDPVLVELFVEYCLDNNLLDRDQVAAEPQSFVSIN